MEDKKTNPPRGINPRIAIPVSAVLALVTFIRACGPQLFHSDVSGERLKASSEWLYHYYTAEVDKIVAERLAKEGPAFLYTNDTETTLRFYPNIHTDNPLGISAFQYTEALKDLREFEHNKDSAELFTFLTSSDGVECVLQPDATLTGDSSAQQLLCMIYDPGQRMQPTADTTMQILFRVRWGVPLHDTTQFMPAFMKSQPGMEMLLAQLRHHPEARFYMSGRQANGISEARFNEAVQELNQLLGKLKVDTTAFQRKVFNTH